MAQIPKFVNIPKARTRISSYAQDREEQPVTFKDLVDFALNMSEATLEIDGTDTVRPGEPLQTVVQYIGPAGTATDTRLLPISKTGNIGSAISPSPLSASDAGTDATITISAFTPQFDFGTLSVSGASITGLAYSTTFFVYLTDFSYTDGSYTAALATTSLLTLASNPGYFYIGTALTPAPGGPPIGGGGGGGFFEP